MNVTELATLATIVVGFTANILAFRLNREADMDDEGLPKWIPWADRLLIVGSLIAVSCVIVPAIVVEKTDHLGRFPRAACAAALVMLGGYFPAILAHYRLIFRGERRGRRKAGEPPEKVIVCLTAAIAFAIFIGVACRWPCSCY